MEKILLLVGFIFIFYDVYGLLNRGMFYVKIYKFYVKIYIFMWLWINFF